MCEYVSVSFPAVGYRAKCILYICIVCYIVLCHIIISEMLSIISTCTEIYLRSPDPTFLFQSKKTNVYLSQAPTHSLTHSLTHPTFLFAKVLARASPSPPLFFPLKKKQTSTSLTHSLTEILTHILKHILTH